MAKVFTKIRQYFNEYVIKIMWIRVLIVPSVLFFMISNYFELEMSILSSKLSSSSDKASVTSQILQMYIKCFLISYTIKCFINIFNAHFIATSMRNGYRNFFYEYLTIKYAEFQTIGIGEAQYNINRRAIALSDFLTSLTMFFISNILFFVLAAYALNKDISWDIRFKIYRIITIFLVVSSILQLLRTKLRKKVNLGLQLNSRKLYDVLFNYERIVAYGNTEVELEKYYNAMSMQAEYGIYYWISYEAIGFLNSFFFVFLNIYLFHQMNLQSYMTKDILEKIIIVMAKLREKVTDLSKDVEDLCTHFTNLDQSIIEFAPKDENDENICINSFDECINIENVSFDFKEKSIFKGVSCILKPGEKVAITGINGGGKSTFIKILLGLYDYKGSIKIDDLEYSSITRHSLRNMISYVPQNSYLFDKSIIENLSMGNTHTSQEKILEFCKLYNMHEIFKELGYNKQIGERGKFLSGGQRQKISFMRAVIKNSPILILDEATSNMDQESELHIIHQIQSHMESKLVLMIVHNLALLESFDRILFFGDNTLIDQGSFKEMYARKGKFAEFYDESIREL
jgi:ABC-type multidrug transport system fused ATPase/permease subunit